MRPALLNQIGESVAGTGIASSGTAVSVLRISFADESDSLLQIKPSGRLLRVLISPRSRVHIAKVDPDASLLRLETPAPRPLLGAGDCARRGRGECGRPPDGGWRPHARRNV